jgi:hypothetical protein
VTIIAWTSIVVVASFAVMAGVLHWLSNRPGTSAAHGPPPLLIPLPPSPPRAQVNGSGNGNGVPRLADRQIVRPLAVEPRRANHRRWPPESVDAEHRSEDNAETIRFVRPSEFDAAVQLLPGRLEVLGGQTPHREIRFMRIPGESAHVVLGRELRHAPHYVGLGSPKVSRQHARFDFADNRWNVTNLSRTNPLVLNDDELFDTDVARPLADGDRLELGDVVLRFHAQ